jgi:hypothetical protein
VGCGSPATHHLPHDDYGIVFAQAVTASPKLQTIQIAS